MGVLRVPSLTDMRAKLLSIDRAMLRRLGTPAHPATRAPRTGEVTKARDVCGAGDAARLIPGARRTRVAPDGTTAACGWRRGDSEASDQVAVNVETLAPGPAGMSGARIATAATWGWRPDREGQKAADIGDRAIVDTYTGEELRDVKLSARRGNVLVHVTIERWRTPGTAKAMRGDAARIARAVLAGYR